MRYARPLSALITLALCLAAACSDDTTGTNNRSNNQTSGANNATNNSTGGTTGGTSQRVLERLEIEPKTVTLTATDATPLEQKFVLKAVYSDGEVAPLIGPKRFEVSDKTIGRVDEFDGTFTANGVVGGALTVTGASTAHAVPAASAQVIVQLAREVRVGELPDDVADRFAAPVEDEAARAAIAYPLNGAVMPQNVYPADVQWINGQPEDLFRITLSKPHARVVAYLKHTGGGFGNHWLVESAAWRAMAQTDPNDAMTITVDRYISAEARAVAGAPITVRFARAALSGTIYYWDIAAGRIVRINDGTGVAEQFMPSPPLTPSNERCVGCHSVSNSGRYMVGRLGGGNNIGNVFDLTADLTATDPPTAWPVEGGRATWWFSSWSPADDRLVVSFEEPSGGLRLVDPTTGQYLDPVAGALPNTRVTQPAWSPDGAQIAYVANIDAWGGQMTAGDIATVDVTGQDSFGESRVIVPGASVPEAKPGGASASYPTWTPDSTRVAFAHGAGARSERDASALYIVNRDGQNLVRLTNASGGPEAADSYQPNFSPFDQDGYFWMMFLSRRDYGNAEVGTRGSGRQQLWVTAIKKDAQPGEDPSAVAYWLPGQSPASMNIAGFWAPRACRADGEGCAVGTECCSGTCVPDQGGALVCSPPPPDRCRQAYESCTSDADCCAAEGSEPPLYCVDSACLPISG